MCRFDTVSIIEIMRQPYSTNDLALAAALSAIGIPLFEFEDASPPYVKTRNLSGSTFTFFFEPESAEGVTKTYEDAWYDDSWVEKNPDHPFTYIKCAFKNRNTLLDVVNQSHTIVIIEKGNKFALLSSNASEETKNAVFSRL